MSISEPLSFGALLLRHRAVAGLTQEELAARAGVSPDAIAALERGRRRAPRGTTAALLADALGLDGQARAQFIAAARGGRDIGDAGRPQAAEGTAPEPRRDPWWRLGQPTPLVDRMRELETIC